MEVVTVDQLGDLAGRELGVSNWITVGQERIDAFADITEDHQFIHVDKERAAAGPFGTTIAHGFLTLSLLTRMTQDVSVTVDGAALMLNYGFDKVRFLAPVPSGARVRTRVTVVDAAERKPGQVLIRYGLVVEIEDSDKPALSAEWLAMAILR